MADLKDISTVITSALDEISVPGTVDVKTGDAAIVRTLAAPAGDPVKVVVTVLEIDAQAEGDERPSAKAD